MHWRADFTGLKQLSLAATMLLLAACVTQPAEQLSFDEKLEQLITSHKYGAAQRLISSHADINEEQRTQHQDKLQVEITAFEHQQRTNAEELRIAKRYGDAITLYQQALGNFPESMLLRDELQTLYSKRDDYVRDLRLSYLLDRADSISNELKMITAISDAKREDEQHKELLAQLNAERDRTALALLQEGQRRLAIKDIKPAIHYLNLSLKLKEDERTITALRLAKRQYKPKKPRRVVVKSKPKLPSQLDISLAAYQDYLDNTELRKALVAIRKAAKLAPDNSDIQAKKNKLNQRIDKIVNVAVEEGKFQYSQGNINAAIKSWQSAAVLAPYDDALKERLAKALRFRERYEALRD